METDVKKSAVDLLREVIAINRAQQVRARELNTRAGKKVFPAFTLQEWEERLKPFLAGAVSASTIPDIGSLRLAPLDEQVVELVLAENPETVPVLGESHAVVYENGRAPRVVFEGSSILDGNRWRELPDAGVKLPGVRAVEIVVSFGYYDSITEVDIPRLKEKLRMKLNQKQWDEWSESARPSIALPDFASDEVVFPAIATSVYGTCAVTGEALVAFGTIEAYRGWSSDPLTWNPKWFRSCEEAEVTRAKSAEKLVGEIAKAREEKVSKEARGAAEMAQAKTKSLYDSLSYGEIGDELRSRLYSARYAHLPFQSAELYQWTVDTEALCTEVEADVAQAMRKKEEENARTRQRARPILRPGETVRAVGAEEAATTTPSPVCADSIKRAPLNLSALRSKWGAR